MICKNPFVTLGSAFPCGSCTPCRINRARVWKHRLILEGKCRSDNCFLTLTYMDEKLPVLSGKDTGEILATLRPKDLQDWLKRLRKVISPLKIRFYGCGEYGSKTWRPHYHVVLFGFPGCSNGKTRRDFQTNRVAPHQCCRWCNIVNDTWGLGDVELGQFNDATAGYVSDYVIKNLARHDNKFLRGRYPEFARMSNRPGIGASSVNNVVEALLPVNGVIKDVPVSLKHGVKSMPLGRYLRSKVREGLGRERGCPDEVLLEYAASLRELREIAKNSTENPSFKKHLMASFEGAVLNMEAAHQVFGQKKRVL